MFAAKNKLKKVIVV